MAKRTARRAAPLLAAGTALLPGIAAILLLAGSLWAAGAAAAPVGRRWAPLDRAISRRWTPERPPGPAWPAGDRLVTLRWLVVGCQAVTILVTWNVWGNRGNPPLLPVHGFPSPPINLGVLLLGSLALTLHRPVLGAWTHAGLLLIGFLADQTRIQPEVVSLGLLLLAASLPRIGITLGRAHLITLWIWSGLNKLLSVGFSSGTALWILDGLPLHVGALRPHAGWVIAGTEVAVGLCVLVAPLRRVGVALALGLHGMILWVLSPFGHDWNQAVWAWNVALPLAAVLLLWPGRLPGLAPLDASALSGSLTLRRAIGAAAAVYPAGFYLGVVDAYLAHNLYTDNLPLAYCVPARTCAQPSSQVTFAALDVPLPAEPRLYREYFALTCRRGDELIILPRQVRLLFGVDSKPQRYTCAARPAP